jgi:hypothetical protein
LTASALAERVDTSAKALAAQVEVTAKAAAAATEASSKAFSERITPLEQMRYEQSGKSIISTPLQMSIVAFCTLLLAYIFQRLMTQVKKE